MCAINLSMNEGINYNKMYIYFSQKFLCTVIFCIMFTRRVTERYKTRFVLRASILNLIVAYPLTKIN